MITATQPQWLNNLRAFYQFIEGANQHLKEKRFDEVDQALITQIDNLLATERITSNGNTTRELKFASAIHGDVERLIVWQSYLQNYNADELHRMQDFIALELNGLGGDMKPRAILTSTLPAAIITGLSLAAAWSALGAIYFGINIYDIAVEVLVERLRGINWLRSVFSAVFVMGGFAGIAWYVGASYKNQQQVQLLHSLNRAITLFLMRG